MMETGVLLVTIIGLIGGQGRIEGAEACDLAREGRPACTIIIAEKPSPAARLAALELQYHIVRISGAEIPIRSENEKIEGGRILVGESAATRRLGFRGADFEPQEYLIAFRPDAIILIGRDWEDTEENRRVEGRPMAGETLQALRHRIDYWKAVGRPDRSTGEMELPGLLDDQGTCLAAYDFLERFCGVRWYGPSELGIVIPARETLSAGGPDIRRAPALRHRGAFPGGNWPFLRGQWGDFTREQVHLYWRRIRQGGERWAANHTFHRETIRTVFNDPEYQCKNPRGAGSQLCYTNAKLIEQVAQMARDYFDGKIVLPAGWKAAGDYFAIVPDDNMNLCTCDACRTLLRKGSGRATGFFSSGEMSDYWYSFVNAVAREVRKTHPEKYIATLAYWSYAFPPGFDIEPNVSVAPCLHTCYYAVHPEMRENDMKFYRGWLDRVSRNDIDASRADVAPSAIGVASARFPPERGDRGGYHEVGDRSDGPRLSDPTGNERSAPTHPGLDAGAADGEGGDPPLTGLRLRRVATKAPMFLWVYYHHPMEPALIQGWKCFPNVMVHETARAMRAFLRDGVRGIYECGEQDQLEQYIMVKVWDDPDVDVDGLIDEFFRLYFGAAGDPMRTFYLRLEAIACDPANYPPPVHRANGIDWRGAAWQHLGTSERMEELGALMAKAEKLAGTETEKRRVALWRNAIWEWMRQGSGR
ncbi:MAG: DUF4838 domain-containing protein [Planctomycetes bacterium]|nr:DUF4838 domain-containing protein [Planctomycetota bacterium]